MASHPPCVSDGDTTEAMPGLGFKDIPHTIPGTEDHRVCDESLLIFLERVVKKGTSEPFSSNSWSEAWDLCQLPLWQCHRIRSQSHKPFKPRARKHEWTVGTVHVVLFCSCKSQAPPQEMNPHSEKKVRRINHPSPPHSTTVKFPGTHDPRPSDLHFPNFIGLEFWCTIMMNEANTTRKLQDR